jgi:carboxylesterase type B
MNFLSSRFRSCLLYLSIVFLFSHAEAYTDPIVNLTYGSFQGAYSDTYNITHFRKIPFGASTAGINRFRAPQPPAAIPHGEIYDTNQSFDMCPQRTVNGSEDCLYLGVYSRPWNAGAKRPVLVVFYGGGFIQGSASFSIPPSMYPALNVSSENDFIVVYPNYRTNALGLLPGRAVKEAKYADLNAGLLDQRAALEWVSDNIGHFGGDPDRIAVQGQSAGGGSVIAQVLGDGVGRKKPLVQHALGGSPFWPKTYKYDDPEAEALYTRFVELAGCSDAKNSLQCLKDADIQDLRNASLTISNAGTYTSSQFNWSPVVDGTFIREPLSSVQKVRASTAWSMYNTHEGENFVPPGFANATGDSYGYNSSEASFDIWLAQYLPRFSKQQLNDVKELYPINGTSENAAWSINTTTRAGMIFRDSVLACPGLWMAEVAGKGYLGEYTISPAKHGSDTTYVSPIPVLWVLYPN